MAKVDIWMPWYITDYMRDTGELTVEEDCFYRRALDQCWLRRGGIPTDTTRLCSLLRFSPTQFKRCKWILERFFYSSEDGYRNTRLDHLLWQAANLKNAAANGARKTNEKRWGKPSPSVSPSDSDSDAQCESPNGRTSPSPSFPSEKKTPLPPEGVWFSDPVFAETWNAWGKSRKKKPTDRQYRAIEKLAGGSIQTAIAILNQSTDNGWTGIFPLKGTSNGTNRTNRSESLDAGASAFVSRVREAQRPDRSANPSDGDFDTHADTGT